MSGMGGKLTFTYGSNCTFGDLTKLGETLRKRRRNVPLAERCFELLDQSNQLFRDGLHIGCRRLPIVVCRSLLVW